MKSLRMILLFSLLCVSLNACHFHSRSPDKTRVYKESYSLTRDGHYRVRKGDTLHAIAFNFGIDWREIARVNNIRSPYIIYPDQELKMPSAKQPGGTRSSTRTASASGNATTAGSASGSTTTKPLKTPSATTRTASPSSGTPGSSADPGDWLWPTRGRIISNFKANDPSRNGIEIGGKEGQAIISTAAGEVVYSGNGLIGYGELIIIKHSDRMLSAYAHNRKRLVAEGQKVTAGMKIAEMGRNDRNQTLLHFEIRVNGNPTNPMNYLPRP